MKPAENADLEPTGLPFGLPETPGGHIRPFTCLVAQEAFVLFPSVNESATAACGAVLNAEPTAAVALRESSPASGFLTLPQCPGITSGKAEPMTTAARTTKERWYLVETHNIAGEVALKSPEPHAAKAEAYFQRALSVARQQAKSGELRAAMSLARGRHCHRCQTKTPARRSEAWPEFFIRSEKAGSPTHGINSSSRRLCGSQSIASSPRCQMNSCGGGRCALSIKFGPIGMRQLPKLRQP